MRKTIITMCIITISFGILIQPVVMNAIFGFLFAGIVPGTSIILPFWAMSCVLAVIGYSAMKWLQRDTLFIGDEQYVEQQRKQYARAYVLQKTLRSSVKRPVAVRQRLRRRQQTATS